jgi:hypothetical protein
MTFNPVRDSSVRISVAKKSPRALTPEETTELTRWFRANARAVALDIPDLIRGEATLAGRARRLSVRGRGAVLHLCVPDLLHVAGTAHPAFAVADLDAH